MAPPSWVSTAFLATVLVVLPVSHAKICGNVLGVGFRGSFEIDVLGRPFFTATPGECCDACFANSDCKFWSFRQDVQPPSITNSCTIFRRIIDTVANTGSTFYTSGTITRECAGDASSCGPPGNCVACSAPTPYCVGQQCLANGGGASDPMMTGFDGKSFHFDSTGDFLLLASEGMEVHATFAGATALDESNHVMERSWTRSIRVHNRVGDMVTCSLPAVLPNTSTLQVTAVPARAPATHRVTALSASTPEVSFPDMEASLLLNDGTSPFPVAGCRIVTPKFTVTAHHISGYQQAMLHAAEGWAKDFTWRDTAGSLDTEIILTKPLTPPVSGIIGATYPVGKAAEEAFLRAGNDAAAGDGLTADIGEGRAGRTVASSIRTRHMAAWIAGLAR
ncbi:hypothetical protein N2152v2_004102 [Parachlorella kessleri]